ncbi:MAG: PQQ-binding-like beta-propeller repeat protein [Tepidisphaerales bacterium]
MEQTHLVGVVPIFVNAGTALLPAILAPLAAVAANILRPRELTRILRQNPLVGLVLLVILAGAVWGGIWVFSDNTPRARAKGTDSPRIAKTDWADWAIKRMKAGATSRPANSIQVQTHAGPVCFRSNQSRTGCDGSAALLKLQPAWAHNPEKEAMYLSSPTVYGDKVYAASCLIDIAGNFGTLYCLDAPTGQELWKTEKFGDADLKGFFSSPAVTADGKFVVVGQGLHDDKDSFLVCFNALTGKAHWRVPTPLHIESSPAIYGDLAVAGAGAIEGPDHKATSDPGFVLAVRISDGKLMWRYAVNDPESSPVFGPDGTVYVGSGFNGEAVVALRSEPDAKERLIWRTPSPYPMTGAITLVDDLVIAGGGNCDYVNADPKPAGVVLALDAKTGHKRWEKTMPDSVLGSIAAIGGKLICPLRNGEVVVLKQADGSVLWKQSVNADNPVLAGAAVAGDYIYVVSRDGTLAVLKLSDGSVIEKVFLNDPKNPGKRGLSLSSPTIANGLLFVGSETGGIRAFSSGKVGQ